MDIAQYIGIAIFLGIIVILLLIAFINTNVIICSPNEIVIISGRQHKGPDNQKIGYRVIRGGRGFKWPFIESVSRLSLNTRTIKVNLNKVLQLKPDHCNVMANQGKAYTAKKDWPNALAALTNATECSPGMALAW